jgi:hypothetical protein
MNKFRQASSRRETASPSELRLTTLTMSPSVLDFHILRLSRQDAGMAYADLCDGVICIGAPGARNTSDTEGGADA